MAKSATRFKQNAQRIHFKRRLAERFGIEINRETYNNIIEAINTSRKVPVKLNGIDFNLSASYRAKQSNRVKVYCLNIDGVAGEIPVAYDTLRKELVTAHPEMLESHRNLD